METIARFIDDMEDVLEALRDDDQSSLQCNITFLNEALCNIQNSILPSESKIVDMFIRGTIPAMKRHLSNLHNMEQSINLLSYICTHNEDWEEQWDHKELLNCSDEMFMRILDISDRYFEDPSNRPVESSINTESIDEDYNTDSDFEENNSAYDSSDADTMDAESERNDEEPESVDYVERTNRLTAELNAAEARNKRLVEIQDMLLKISMEPHVEYDYVVLMYHTAAIRDELRR